MRGIGKMEEKINFEETMKQLEEVAIQLEKGNLTLDESVEKFEMGMKLSKQCSKTLEEAERRITILLKNEDGNLEEQNFTVQD